MRVDLYNGVLTDANCYPASSLIETFKEYIIKGSFWAFGRDVPYHKPPKMYDYSVRHIHLISCKKYRQYENSNVRLYNRTSDKHFVYARSPIDDNHYLLITIIDPEAHQTAENTNFMHQLYEICKKHFG